MIIDEESKKRLLKIFDVIVEKSMIMQRRHPIWVELLEKDRIEENEIDWRTYQTFSWAITDLMMYICTLEKDEADLLSSFVHKHQCRLESIITLKLIELETWNEMNRGKNA